MPSIDVFPDPDRAYVNVQVLDGAGELLQDDLPFMTGSVTASLNSGVSRNLELTVDETWYPWNQDDLLAPYGNRIRAWRGIEFGDGTVMKWVVFTGRIQDSLATSVGALWYPLADGRFTLRRFPWTQTGQPVVVYRDGPTGSVSKSFPARTRTSVTNSLTVVSERLNGAPPQYATERDDQPASATYIDGNFGRRHQLEVRGRTGIAQVVSNFRMPLDIGTAMTVQGRAQVLAALEGD
jgi:hypothetical protein